MTSLHHGNGRRYVTVLAGYCLLALWLTWPLVTRFTTHVPGDGIDDPALAWNLWWLRERLVAQANPDIFHVGWMFHPIQINLAFYTLTPLNGLVSIPLQLALRLVTASNLVLLASFVSGAFGMFLLVRDQRWWFTRSASTVAAAQLASPIWWLAPFVGGVIFAFASSKLFYASLGQFNIASSQWIPFCLLYLLRMARPHDAACSPSAARRTRLRAAALAALFFGFQLWAELTFASFLLIFAGLLLLWQLLTQWRGWRWVWCEMLPPFLLFSVLAAATLLPLFWAMLPDLRTEGDFFASGGGFADVFSADLFGYLVTTRLHPVWGDWVATLPFPNDKGQQIYVGYTAITLSVLGLWSLARQQATRPLAWLWGASLLLFWTLTLGPEVRWLGQSTGIPGPFTVVSQLPFFSGNRYPSRYSVMLMASIALLSSYGVAWLLTRLSVTAARQEGGERPWRAAAVVVLLGLLFLFEHLTTPLPLSDFRIPDIYRRLAQEPGDFAILELPTGWRNGARVLGKADVLIMMQQWWQTEHGKRRLGGNTSRNPESKFQYFTEAPLLGELIALMNADRPHIGPFIDAEYPAWVETYRPRAAAILQDLGIRYVLVHEEQATPQLLQFVRDALPLTEVDRWQGENWAGLPATIVRYAVNAPAPPAVRTISLADDFAPLYLGEGWATLPTADGIRYAIRPEATLLIDLPVAGGSLTFDWHGPAATLRAAINDRPVATHLVTPGRTEVALPAGLADQPVDRISLHFAGGGTPSSQVVPLPAGDQWPIGATGAALPARNWLVVRSAGEEAGDFAHLFVDGRDVAPNTRGYNLVALDDTGAVLESAAFDTSGDPQASAALAAWVAKWPAGTIIAGAVNDEASLMLDEAAVAALQHLGVAADLRGRLRWSHAFVGAVGAPPGSAIEKSTLLRPATVAVGAPLESEKAFGGLRSLTIRANGQ